MDKNFTEVILNKYSVDIDLDSDFIVISDINLDSILGKDQSKLTVNTGVS